MLIKIRNLNKAYYSETKTITRALENINLDFKEKGLNFIVGESGSGKSTLLNIIGAIDTFDSGSVIVGDHSLKDMDDKELDYYRNGVIGFVFQEFNLLEDFNVRENVKMSLDLNNICDDKILDNMLVALGIKEIQLNNVKNISSGQKQRVAIARALIKDPSILIADEPTGALDSKNAREIMEVLKEISKEKLVIVITHDTDFALTYGDRIIELKDGKIVKDIEKGVIKNTNVKELAPNLIKINKLDEDVVKKINDIRQDYGQKVYVSSNKNIRKTKALFPKAMLVEHPNSDFKISEKNKEKMKKVDLNKTRLSFKNLSKLAISNLLSKKKILILTIILISFSLMFYGASEGLVNYNKIDAYAVTINKEKVKMVNLVEKNGQLNKKIREENIAILKENYKSINIAKEYYLPLEIDFNKTINGTKKYTLSGISEVNNVTTYGYKIIHGNGEINNYNEIVISEYFANLLIDGEYFNSVKCISDLINKEIKLNKNDYLIKGIIMSDYLANYEKESDKIKAYLDIRDNLIFVKEGFIKDYFNKIEYMEYFLDIYLKEGDSLYDENELTISNIIFDSNTDNSKFTYNYYETEKTTLLENEILISESYIENNNMCFHGCNIDSFLNNELVFTYQSSILYSLSNYKVVGTYSYKGNDNDLYNLYSNSVIVSDSLKEKLNENIYYNNQLLVGLSKSSSLNERFIKDSYNLGLSINKNFISLYDEYNEIVDNLSDVFNTASIALLIIAIVLLFTFIQNSILISKRKIGILKSLGVKDFSVFVIFLIESLLVALVSIVVASSLLLAITPLVNVIIRNKYGFYFSALNIDGIILLKISLITIIVSLIALVIPFIKFKRMDTVKLIGSR